MQNILAASGIFTGTEWLNDHAIVTNNGCVEKLIPRSEAEPTRVRDFGDHLIVPAFVDLQVYGAAKRLLAVYPDEETLRLMHENFLNEGTVLFLPTLATNTMEVFKKSIDAVRAYWEKGGQGVYGLHLEGPWLNQEKRGAHVRALIHAPTLAEVKELLDYGEGVIKMITLAPEVCSEEVLDLLLQKNLLLSAGHSNAGSREALHSFDKGIRAVTHLFNAMSPLHHREPGLTGAALYHSKVCASIIPDGHHVDFIALRIAKNIMHERLFAITDAVTETTEGPYRHQLSGDKYECNGVLSGSALSMHKAFFNLVRHGGIEAGEAIRMCSLYPARLLGCEDQYGKIAPQTRGPFLLLDKQLKLVELVTL